MRLSRSIVGRGEASAVSRVISAGYLGMGEETREFERELSEYLGVESWQVVSVNSGTAALHLAVEVLCARGGFSGRPGILVPSLTYVAGFQAILAAGCEPVACDVSLASGTLDLADAASRLQPGVIGVMHVDYASNPWQLDQVYTFAQKYKLGMIDDAAHAFGCRHKGRKIGSFGDLVCFSFDGIKNITCGEGGCLVAFDEASARLAADARLLGVEGDTLKRFTGGRSWDPDVSRQGWRYHMSNIMASIGRVQLGRLESEFIPARRKLYALYRQELHDVEDIRFFETSPEDFIVPHILPIRILNGRRDHVRAVLEMANIPTGMHYKPNHLLSLFGHGAVSLPHTEELYAELVTLPLHPGLEEKDVELVCSTLKSALAN